MRWSEKTAISRYLTLAKVAGARRVAGEGRVHADLQGTTTWPLHNGKNRWTESHSGWAWTRHALPAGYERTSSWHLCRDGEEGLVQRPSRSAKCFKDCSLQCGCWSDWWPCWFPCLPRQDPSTDLFISRDSSWTPTPARVHGQGLHLPVQGRWCTWSLARGLSLSTPHQHWQCCSASNLHQGHRDVGSRKACLAEQLLSCLPVRVCGGCGDQPLGCDCHKVNIWTNIWDWLVGQWIIGHTYLMYLKTCWLLMFRIYNQSRSHPSYSSYFDCVLKVNWTVSTVTCTVHTIPNVRKSSVEGFAKVGIVCGVKTWYHDISR